MIHFEHTHNTNKKDYTLLVKLTSLSAVRQSDDDNLAGPQKASHASIECRVGQPSTARGQNMYA